MVHPEFFWSFAWKSVLWFGAAYLTSAALRRRSASARHLFLTCVLSASVLLAILMPLSAPSPSGFVNRARQQADRFGLVQLLAAPAVPRSDTFSLPRASAFPWVGVWLAGVAILLARLAIGHARLHWMFRHGVPGAEIGVRTIRSGATDLPVTFGVIRSTIVLPADWDSWSADTRRSALIHELAHVERRDPLWNVLASSAVALHWFNPLAWIAMAMFRREQERSCDDIVVREGVDGASYAAQLVDLARMTKPAIEPALGVASRFDLEGRVKALIDPARRREPVSRRSAGLMAVTALALIAPLGLLRAQAGMASLSGTVADPSGAVVADTLVELKLPDGTPVMSTRADAVGSFALRSIPPGSYEFEIGSPGFKSARGVLTLMPGAATQLNTKLQVGETAESVRIMGGEAPKTTVAKSRAERIRVGGNIQAPRLLSRADPVYPADAQAEGVEATVNFRAVITTAGTLVNPVPIGTADPRLVQAGLDALRVWHYSPALLNGLPVETVTNVSFTFQLRR